MKIFIGSDHGGFTHKQAIITHLHEKGLEIDDLGPHEMDADDDYPEFANLVAKKVGAGKGLGILICGSGIGMSIAANKIRGVRAARCATPEDAALSRKHNDANLLCIGGRTSTTGNAITMVDAWLGTKFEAGKHQRRVNKISSMENE